METNNNIKKEEYNYQENKDLMISLNEHSETDEILKQLDILNKITDEKNNYKITKEDNIKPPLEHNMINIPKLNDLNKYYETSQNFNLIIKDEETISLLLLKEKLNRIYITIQGLNFKEKDYDNIINFIPCLIDIEQKNYESYDKLFDVFIELLKRIKDEMIIKEKFIKKLNEISLNKEEYEKKYLKFQKEIKAKENEFIHFCNKINSEKEIIENNYKLKNIEINNLKKENQELTKIINTLQEKIKSFSLEKKENKNNKSILEYNKNGNGLNDSKINDKYFSIKKLNMNLTYLLKEINKIICKYDILLINNNISEKVVDLNNNIESNLLIDDSNMKILRKNLLYNIDKILKKIELIQGRNKIKVKIKKSKEDNNKDAWTKRINFKSISNLKEFYSESNIDIKNYNLINNNNINGIENEKDEKNLKKNLSSKWYDNINNKKVGYVFDKDKVFTCEDDDNGGENKI